MTNKLENIVVVGGGTAGWMTALMVNTRIPTANVTVVESDEIGILGAGEGSTPTFINFLNYVGIDMDDLIKHCGVTFKNGLKFTNWNGDGDEYYHEFSPVNLLNSDKMFHDKDNFGKHTLFYWLNVALNVEPNKFDFVSMVSDLNKAPFQHILHLYPERSSILDYRNVAAFGFHFDAGLIASFFKGIALERGINRKEGKVVGATNNSKNDIESLSLEDGSSVPVDFIFDCSGLHRLLIGKHYNSEWISSEDILTCDSALPFFLPIDETIPPYTECIALEYGWMWKIPLQNRYGCGYVFDSKYLSEEDAAKEIESYLGFEPTYPRKNKGAFKFNPGYYKETWINNCVAIGLSSGFMEPLEATNIGVALINLTDALSDISGLTRRSPEDLKYYNNQVLKLNSEIAMFLHMHYLTQRQDSDFWVQFKDFKKTPERLRVIMRSLNTSIPSVVGLSGWDSFNYGSFYQIALGIKKINLELIKEAVELNGLDSKVINDFYAFRKHLENEASLCLDHREFLTELGGFKK
jgi:tryptophan halogenase